MNTKYHCWPIDASANKPTPFNPCKGVQIKWVKEPPDVVKFGVEFNVTSELILTPEFYTWGFQHDIFSGINGSAGVSSGTEAQTWCESTACPAKELANMENCCIYHYNIHSCPANQEGMTNNLCGPWIPANGDIFTHSQAEVGPPTQGNWSSNVRGLFVEGEHSIIAHYKIAGMHLALMKEVKVHPKSVCGDGSCHVEETCSTCPYDCGTCPLSSLHIGIIVFFSLASVMVIFGFITAILIQKRKLLLDESWIVPYSKLVLNNNTVMFNSVISRISLKYDDDDVFNAQTGMQIFAQTARLDGKLVAVKNINKYNFILNRSVRLEVKEIRELRHQNLCQFVGACVEVPNVCILMEYCPKGALADVLQNDEIPLTWSFRFSFASDIANGMDYLHNHSVIHGRLNSSNCVVDDRWSVKITDYGLPLLRKHDFKSDEMTSEFQSRRRVVYHAPEVGGAFPVFTKPSDVYAYGIILTEIANRSDPYGDEDLDTLPPHWKPPLPNLEKRDNEDDACPTPTALCALIDECLDSRPSERPTFGNTRKILYKINPNKQNPVDLMMAMMEKYSKHLEQIVAERTNDLMIEKQRTDRLLYSMLPKEVADVLRRGYQVEAQYLENVTIYFSDIVGFTTLCSSSTAMDVVNLLNKLYITFDEVIELYHVYKVETIGDAYMVASGVPEPYPTHAAEIARMAIDLVKKCEVFAIPHLPGQKLKIRVGIHSGTVCAGVVGLKMPRYCLFGDTVNTASRMESTGEAYKIHISGNTYKLLQNGNFKFEAREKIQVKGKGEMQTYWLLGEDRQKSVPTITKLEVEQFCDISTQNPGILRVRSLPNGTSSNANSVDNLLNEMNMFM
ncbi:atrial natriuretic peptide receptor 2-like [Saccostrea echinata]|uniref:atrial natriuretic peptide receptor 2-like n=1 Tax=Saccostrea echinata TaxID=191078 RepID=UPI002A82CD65|nr:atrial natriuretic peptide receptor 2-like [Saccostrea echinata]